MSYRLVINDGVKAKEIPMTSINYIQKIFDVDGDFAVETTIEYLDSFVSQNEALIYFENKLLVDGYLSLVEITEDAGGSIISAIISHKVCFLKITDIDVSKSYVPKTKNVKSFLDLVKTNNQNSFANYFINNPTAPYNATLTPSTGDTIMSFLQSFADEHALLMFPSVQNNKSVLNFVDMSHIYNSFDKTVALVDFQDITKKGLFCNYDDQPDEVVIQRGFDFIEYFENKNKKATFTVIKKGNKQLFRPIKRKVVLVRSNINARNSADYGKFVLQSDSLQSMFYRFDTTKKLNLLDVVKIPKNYNIGDYGVVGYISATINQENALYTVFAYPKQRFR